MSHFIALSGVRKAIAVAATVYGFVAGISEWLLDFSDDDNSFYVALF